MKKVSMKLTLVKKGPQLSRTGLITDISSKWLQDNFSTPLCLIYTQLGSVPHLTYEVLQFLTKDRVPLLFPLPNIFNLIEGATTYGKGIGKFVCLEEYPLYISVQDPAIHTETGYNTKFGISISSPKGRTLIDVEKFMLIQENLCPQWYQALCDNETPEDCSKKRLNTSVDRSLLYLDKCIELHSSNERLKNSSIFGAVQGGYDTDARRKSAQLTAERPVDGFVIDGFHRNGEDVLEISFGKIYSILKDIIPLLPEDKPRIFHGPFRPDVLIKLVAHGIDIFDSSYPFLLSEKYRALVFPLRSSGTKNVQVTTMKWEINLSLDHYKEDFLPLIENCSCYTCQKEFSRAYIYHLIQNNEMLAHVLLTLHNLHHYMSFFNVMRDAVTNESLHEFSYLEKYSEYCEL